MIATIESSVKEHIEAFLEYLKKRAADKMHAANGDIIADFVDHFIVIELKRLAAKDETFTTDIELPDEIILDPLRDAKLKMDKIFEDFFKTKGVTAPMSGPLPIPKVPSAAGTAVAKPRNGNGHKSLKNRSLLDGERDDIRAEFMTLNGEIDTDACVRLKADKLSDEVSIFQVTGFMTSLHMKIARGELRVWDMNAYESFLQSHRDMWARYNSPKYATMRAGAPAIPVTASIQPTVSTTPKFTSFPKR